MAQTKHVTIGPDLLQLLDVARRARMAVLLVGPHGIGKSEVLEHYAKTRGLDPHVIDLSLLEATDLTGMPTIVDGRTTFAPPTTLPREGTGRPSVLVLEELNRCDRSVRQPCLQLLTARRLNDYRLPVDCFLVACMNPPDVGYDVDELDPALASRFFMLRVTPDRHAWIAWARTAGVHAPVVRLVEKFTQAFDDTPPRTWTFVSMLVKAAEAEGLGPDEISRIVELMLPAVAARALISEMRLQLPGALGGAEIVADPKRAASLLKQLTAARRLDVVTVMLENLAEYVERPEGRVALKDAAKRDGVLDVLAAAPPDLRTLANRVLEIASAAS